MFKNIYFNGVDILLHYLYLVFSNVYMVILLYIYIIYIYIYIYAYIYKRHILGMI